MKVLFAVMVYASLGINIIPEPEPPKQAVIRVTKIKEKKTVKVKLTSYCPCEACSGEYGRNTATGKRATAGRTVAVDPSVFKYGTKFKIGKHTYTAEDCGGGVKGNHIDIFFDTHEEVEQFGMKYKKVEVIE